MSVRVVKRFIKQRAMKAGASSQQHIEHEVDEPIEVQHDTQSQYHAQQREEADAMTIEESPSAKEWFSVASSKSPFSEISIEPDSALERHWYDLANKDVAKTVTQSTVRDWLYAPKNDIFSYRPNLMIRLEKQSPNDDYAVCFGARKIGTVQFADSAREAIDVISVDEDDDAEADVYTTLSHNVVSM